MAISVFVSFIVFASLAANAQNEPEMPAYECQRDRCAQQRQLHSLSSPPGNLHPRYPYAAMRFNYYDRPYNAMDLTQSRQTSAANGQWSTGRWSGAMLESISLPYEARFADEAELLPPSGWQKLNDFTPVSATKDKCLEYVDWRQRREARIRWELAPADDLNEDLQIEPATTRRFYSPLNGNH